jgi:L-rhamnonate dehydratase
LLQVYNPLTNIPTSPPPLLEGLSRANTIIVEIETDNGIIRYGATGGSLPWSIVEFVNRQVRPSLIGQDPLLTERIWHQMQRQFNQRTLTDVWSQGTSAVDIALWDIKGKALGLPVWKLLGGAQNPVPAYITFGLPSYSKDQLAEAARYWVQDQGQDKLKMVVGVIGDSQDPEADAERVAAVRDAVGPKVQLMMDAKYHLTAHHALQLCKLCEPLNITWFEEPVYQNDTRLLADLRRQTTIPLAAGQNEGHRWRHRELIVGDYILEARLKLSY